MFYSELQGSSSCIKPWYMQANGLPLPEHPKVVAYNRNNTGTEINFDWLDNANQVLEQIELLQKWGCQVDDVIKQISLAEVRQDIDSQIIKLANRANNKLRAYNRFLTQKLKKELQANPLDYITIRDFSYDSSISFDTTGFKVKFGRFESPAIVNLDLDQIKEELREPVKTLINNLSASSICGDIWTVVSQADYVVTEIMDESNIGELRTLIKELGEYDGGSVAPSFPKWLIEIVENYYCNEIDTFLKDISCLEEIVSRLEVACICLEISNNMSTEIDNYKVACQQIIKLLNNRESNTEKEKLILAVSEYCLKDSFLDVDYEPIEYDGDALLGSGRIVIFANDETTEEFCNDLFGHYYDSEESNGSITISSKCLKVYEAIVKAEYCLAVISNAIVNC